MKSFIKSIAIIQQALKAPKGQYNKFGKYPYRNCEDILEAVKPLLGVMILTISDELVLVGDRYYVKATATITDGEHSIHNTAFARESLNKKGMDDSQITGAASSYARKYAMNGLLCCDDTKDADSMDNTKPEKKEPEIKWYNDFAKHQATMIASIESGEKTPESIIANLQKAGYKVSKDIQDKIKALKTTDNWSE